MRARRAKQKIQISVLCPSVSVYADIYPQTQLPWSNTQFSLLQASKENAEEHSDQFKFIGCTQANSSKYSKINKGHQKIGMIIIITEDYSDLDDYAHI